MLLLHGGSGSWTHWLRNIQPLVDAGRQVLVPDLPGFGDSANKKGTERGPRGSMLTLLALPGFAAGVGIMFLARFTDRALPPILPLYLIELKTPSAQLATITGFVVRFTSSKR